MLPMYHLQSPIPQTRDGMDGAFPGPEETAEDRDGGDDSGYAAEERR